MNCQDFQRQIVLSTYEELQEGERSGLETHLRECAGCRQASEENQEFFGILSGDDAAWDIPPGLLVESRRSLANRLDQIEAKRSWWRVPTFSVVFTPMRMLESATLIAMGLAFGVYISNHSLSSESPAVNSANVFTALPEGGRVSNVRIVNTDANTATVEFVGDVVQPLRFTGHMEDETTQRLLFSAVQDSSNPAARMQAVDMLATKSAEPSIKELLIHHLLNDESLNVRLKAAAVLKPFAGDDDVQTAFMQALMSDPDDGVRIAVVDGLAPFTKTEAMATSIENVTRNDENTYVRLKGQGLIRMVGERR